MANDWSICRFSVDVPPMGSQIMSDCMSAIRDRVEELRRDYNSALNRHGGMKHLYTIEQGDRIYPCEGRITF